MRKALRLTAAAAVGLMLGSAILAENALHVPQDSAGLLSAAQAFAGDAAIAESVRIRAADGAPLEAWLFTPVHPNGAAVIVMHGVADTRAGMLTQARFLVDAGYTVLTPDSRAHGASGGQIVTYGVLEAGDTHLWANLLMSRPGTKRLYGAGQSMGAAILLQSLACETRFRAVVADCPYATFREVALDRLAQHGSPARFLSWPAVELGFLYARARYGVDLQQASPENALRGSRTPVLFIHGTDDRNIPIRHSRNLHAIHPQTTELWEVQGADHVASIGQDPERYARRVLAFFAAHP